ncbi:MAG: tRNA dihydrouridine synthase, partial [Bacillota bacterium]
HIPLTAKLRLGWDDAHIVAPQLAARLENAGVALIAIHGRTTEMQFSGQCRLDGIAQVVAAVKRIPVIGNGDIRSPQDADHMIKTTGCAGVMIGRKAIAMPWIFRDTWSYLTTGTIPPPPTIDQICQMMRDHFYNIIRFRNERVALIEFRHRISWYAKQLHPCRALRDQMRLINSPADFERALTTFLDWRHYRDQQIQKGHLPPNPHPAPPALCPSLPHP